MISVEARHSSLEATRPNGHIAKMYEVLEKRFPATGESVPALLTIPARYFVGRFSPDDTSPDKIDLPMNETQTSRIHVELELDRNRNLYILDRSSKNGTFILMNGKPLRLDFGVRIPVGNNDIFTFGPGMPRYQFRRVEGKGWMMVRNELNESTRVNSPVPKW
jgi:hypothetical protein